MQEDIKKSYEAGRHFDNKAFRSACYAPFVSLFFTNQGKVLACCKNGNFILGDVKHQRLPDIWNGEKVKQLREALREYRFDSGCRFCEWEITGGNYQTAVPLLFDEFPVRSNAPEFPAMIEFEGSNICNFECIMCNGETSSSIRANRDGLLPLPKAYSEQFFQDLRQFLPHLQRARFFGGEPFLTRESHRIWEMMIDDGLSIPCHVTTNGSQYNGKIERLLEKIPFFLTVSIDGATKETVEKIRINSSYEQLLENIQRFHEYTKRRGTTFNLAFCLMRQNWHEFGDLLLLAEDLGCQVLVNTVIDPSYCSLYTLPRQELVRVLDQLQRQGSSLVNKLSLNRKTWEEAIIKLSGASKESQGKEMAGVLSSYYRPDDPLNRGWEFAEEGRYAEALDEARKIPESDGSYFYMMNLSGYAKAMLGDLEGAERDLHGAFKLSRKRGETFLYMARLRLKQNRVQESLENALRARELAVREDRLEYEACEMLAFIYTRKGQLLQAIRALKPIARMQSYGSEIQDLVYPVTGLRPRLLHETNADPEDLWPRTLRLIVRILLTVLSLRLKMRTNAKSRMNRGQNSRTKLVQKLRRAPTNLKDKLRAARARIFHQLPLTRLRIDRIIARFLHPNRFRVLATACRNFPIYSQTFVYQELTQLIRNGFQLRFLYGKLDTRKQLSSQFNPLWRAKRRVIFHHEVCKRDYDYFAKRMPEKINSLVDLVSKASGKSPEELRNHSHFLQAFAFTRMVEAYRPNYLHSYFFYEGSLFTLFASYLLDIPRGVSCYADHMLKDYSFKMIPLHLDQCSLVIATSQRIRQELLSIAPGANFNHILIKPNAINAAQFQDKGHEDPKTGQPFRLITVSRIEPKKGLIYLVDAVRYLRDRNMNIELHIVGGVDTNPLSQDYAQELKDRIAELRLTDIVHQEGFKTETEIQYLFGISHMFIAPFVQTEYGDKDGIPTSLLEAMASGLPVVATDAGSIQEVVEDGQDGLLVPQRDPKALADRIADLLNDPERRAWLGKNAAQKVREKFDVNVCEEIFHSRLSRLLTLENKIAKNSAQKPLVSIVTAFFNGEKFIREAIESVLAQTYENWELLLIDDGSSDGSTAIAQEYAKQHSGKIFYLQHQNHENRGAAPSRNVGVRRAKGEYIAILDADDIWLPYKLQRQVAILESEPRAAMLCGASRYWSGWSGKPEDLELDNTHDLGIEPEMLYEPPVLLTLLYPLGEGGAPCPSNVLLRRSMMERDGGFEENFLGMYQLYEDQVFLSKIYLKQPVFVSSELWDQYRIHPDSCVSKVNAAGQYDTVRKFFLDWLEKYLSEQKMKDTVPWTALQQALSDYGSEKDVRKSKWSLRVAGGNTASLLFPPHEPDMVRVVIRRAETKTSYDIQLNQPRLKVKSKCGYNLKFSARADSPRSISFGFARAGQPWTNLGLYRKIQLTSEWRNCEENFISTADEDNGRIHFDLGECDIPVELSSVSISRIAEAETIESNFPSREMGLTEVYGASLGGLPQHNSRIAIGAKVAATERVEQATALETNSLITPVSLDWGWDRGLPIDRYYIEKFLAYHARDFRGSVLEIGDNSYTRRFGGDDVRTTEILDINDQNPRATIIADLTLADHIASNTFDCIVLPQTLQFIYDVQAAIRSLYRILKTDGVLLATLPGITRTRMDDPSGSWYWSFTTASAQRLFIEVFSQPNMKIRSYGNVLVAVSFLRGLASEEVSQEDLDCMDPSYQVLVTVRAVKS